MNRVQIDQMVKSRDMSEFYKCFSSDPDLGVKLFKTKVDEFDQINIKMIELYGHHLVELDKQLNKPELIKALKPLTEILYWRRKPNS